MIQIKNSFQLHWFLSI